MDAFRIRNILAFSFQSVFLSLVPFVLALFSLREPAIWQVSLLILAIATLADAVLVPGAPARALRAPISLQTLRSAA